MEIADYFVLISPVGIPFFTTGLQELKKDPLMLGGFLKALEGFTNEDFVEKKQPIVNIRHIQWKEFNITLCNPYCDKWDLEEPEKVADRELTPLLATFNFSNRPHLQDPTILKGILRYLFNGLELKTWMDQIENVGKMSNELNKKLESRVRHVIFGEVSKDHVADGLIVTVGTSWGSIFAALQRHNPKFTVFLCSKASESYARKICKTFGLAEKEDFQIFLMNPDDTSIVAKTAASAHKLILEKVGKDASVVINATGGTKALTSGAMHYGFVRHLKTCYVISQGFRGTREDRIHGDEQILLLDNPVQSVGFFYEKQGIDAFNSQNFKVAIEYFSQLAFNIHDLNVAIYFEALAVLSEAYNSQKNMDYEKLVLLYQQVIQKFIRFCYTKHSHSKTVNKFLPKLEKQEMLAHRLTSRDSKDIIIHICEQMNQSNRLIEEGCFHLAILQGSLVIDKILDYLLSQISLEKRDSILKTFDCDLNYLLALDLKLEVLNKNNHKFIQYYGPEKIKNLITEMKKFFQYEERLSIDFKKEDYKKAVELVKELFNQFILFFGGEEGLKDCRALQFIYLDTPMLLSRD